MANHSSEYVQMTKRSIFWLLFVAASVSATYYFQGNAYIHTFDAISVSTGTVELPIHCVETDKKQVALTFDVTRGNEDTQKILNILKEQDIRTTFFVTGDFVDNYPDDVKSICEYGHDLGNHSQNHNSMGNLSSDEIRKELEQISTNVKNLTGYQMELFRAPYGDYDNHVISTARNCGLFTIQYSVDSCDWKNYGVDDIAKAVLTHQNLKNGSIILLHTGAKYTSEALPKIISGLKDQGYEIVPVSQLIYRDSYHITSDGCQISNANKSTTEQSPSDNPTTAHLSQ